MAVSRFPTDSRYAGSYGGDVSGPVVNYFQQQPDVYPGVIVKQMLVGATRGADSTSRIRKWTLHYRGLTRTLAKQLDDHFAEAKGQLLPFEFRQWRTGMDDTGVLYTNVHYESLSKPQEDTNIEAQERVIVLVKEGLA